MKFRQLSIIEKSRYKILFGVEPGRFATRGKVLKQIQNSRKEIQEQLTKFREEKDRLVVERDGLKEVKQEGNIPKNYQEELQERIRKTKATIKNKNDSIKALKSQLDKLNKFESSLKT